MIELSLTNKQARALAAALAGIPSVSDIFAEVSAQLDREAAHAARMAPWRKVIRCEAVGSYMRDILECGHTHMLRQSTRAGCGWIEDSAKKRRCEQCRRVIATESDVKAIR
jgi:hypothetical protein